MDEPFIIAATPVVGILSLGFALGLKHATEADHLAAVSTIVSDRKNLLNSVLVGGMWGLGHTISLVIAGFFVLLLDFRISQRAEAIFEMCVGAMLVFLGLNVFRRLISGGHLHFHTHEHGGRVHAHPHIHDAVEPQGDRTHHGLVFNARSLLVGMVHGLAGSAALMLLVIPTIESRMIGMLYVVIFGVGSIGGMMLMSLIIGLPFSLSATKFSRLHTVLQGFAGAVGILLGLWIMYDRFQSV